MLSLVDITPENWRQFTRLEIAESQRGQVASNVLMLARAYVFRDGQARARGICWDGEPVGLLLERQEGKVCILDQFMIAAPFQGQGMGTAVMRDWMQEMRDSGRFDTIILCYVEGHDEVRRFYERLGFTPNGTVDGDEVVMECRLD